MSTSRTDYRDVLSVKFGEVESKINLTDYLTTPAKELDGPWKGGKI